MSNSTSFDHGYNSFEESFSSLSLKKTKKCIKKLFKKDSSPCLLNPTESNKKLIKRYEIKSILNCSQTAQLYKAVSKKTGKKVIIKRCLKSSNEQSEVTLSKKANKICPSSTLKVKYENQDDQFFSFVQEEFGTSLYDFMFQRRAALTLNESKYIYKQLLICLVKLQNRGIFHLDIKEENILIDAKTLEIKLIDFGVSRTDPIPKNRRIGSKEFYAPEILVGCSNESSLSKHDVWSFGVALYSSLTGQVPYSSMEDLLMGESKIDLKKFSGEGNLVEVFEKCFCVDYTKRVGFQDLLKCRFFN